MEFNVVFKLGVKSVGFQNEVNIKIFRCLYLFYILKIKRKLSFINNKMLFDIGFLYNIQYNNLCVYL